MPVVSMRVNGSRVRESVEGRTLLAQFLRDHLALTGPHVGCDTTRRGCCTMQVDGVAVTSCTILALSCDDASITAIEGFASGPKLHPMQAALREHHDLQWGYCTPGMIVPRFRSCSIAAMKHSG